MTRFISPREDVKLLVVSVPEGSSVYLDALVNYLRFRIYVKGKPVPYEEDIELPPGEYFPLGIAAELPEEVVEDLVVQVEVNEQMYYSDYGGGIRERAISSWHSFLRREGITERVFVLRVK